MKLFDALRRAVRPKTVTEYGEEQALKHPDGRPASEANRIINSVAPGLQSQPLTSVPTSTGVHGLTPGTPGQVYYPPTGDEYTGNK